MKNEFCVLILSAFLCLTSCTHTPDDSLTSESSESADGFSGDTTLSGKDRAIMNLNIEDSSKYNFLVENPAGTFEYQRFDFEQNKWNKVPSPIQETFLSGPLHAGRIIHQKDLWRDSAWFFLYSKQLERGMVLEVTPLALVEINDDPSRSVYIMVPEQKEYRLPDCNSFDEWFTICNDQRFFIQYWIEHQFAPRYVRRIQWKPFGY